MIKKINRHLNRRAVETRPMSTLISRERWSRRDSLGIRSCKANLIRMTSTLLVMIKSLLRIISRMMRIKTCVILICLCLNHLETRNASKKRSNVRQERSRSGYELSVCASKRTCWDGSKSVSRGSETSWWRSLKSRMRRERRGSVRRKPRGTTKRSKSAGLRRKSGGRKKKTEKEKRKPSRSRERYRKGQRGRERKTLGERKRSRGVLKRYGTAQTYRVSSTPKLHTLDSFIRSLLNSRRKLLWMRCPRKISPSAGTSLFLFLLRVYSQGPVDYQWLNW